MKYRDDSINTHMMLIELLLTAISEKNSGNLDVKNIMKKDELLSFDKAVLSGMMQSANAAIIATKALAMSFDRVTAMTKQMAEEMKTAGIDNAERYEKRLEVVTDINRIMDELDPEMIRYFADRI